MATGPQALIEAEGLSFVRSESGALWELRVAEFRIVAGDKLALTGPSGCGKSTLLALLGLCVPPTAAERFYLLGVDVMPLWRAGKDTALSRLRARAIGFIPQGSALVPYLSVGANIRLTQALAGRRDDELTTKLAALLDITPLLRRAPRTLSGGERQRVAVARALAHRPDIVLADEPTAAVHPALADRVLQLLMEAAGEAGAALIVATHDVARASAAGLRCHACRVAETCSRTEFSVP